MVFRHRITVGDADLDELGHANNIGYLRWLQDAAVAHSAASGLTFARYVELGGVFVVRRHEIDYLRSALRGDELEVRTHVATVMAAKSERRYEIVRLADETIEPRTPERSDGSRFGHEEIIARALTVWGFVDVRTGRPMRIPDEIYDAFGFERRKKRALSE